MGATVGLVASDHHHGRQLGGRDSGELETSAGLFFNFQRRLSVAGLVAGNTYGYVGLVIYLLVYTFMNMGAFAS